LDHRTEQIALLIVLGGLVAGAGLLWLLHANGVGLLFAIVLQNLLVAGVIVTAYGLLFRRPIQRTCDILKHAATSERIDLTLHFDGDRNGACRQVHESINQLARACDKAVIEIAASAGRLAPIAKELADNYGYQAQRAGMQHLHSDTVAQAMGKLQDVSAVVNQQVDATQTAISETDARVNSCQSVFEQTQVSMNSLCDQIDLASTKVTGLAERSNDIERIIDVINNIASQTNLLALNAAIEAARAGESGRGFAVVADEVRNLAERTHQSTLEVQALIESIQNETVNVVETMTEGRTLADRTQQLSAASSQELSNIGQKVKEISDIMPEILQAMEQQRMSAAETQSAVDALIELERIKPVAEEVSSVSDGDLIKLGQALRAKIDRFVLSKDGWDDRQRPVRGKRTHAAAEPDAD